MAKNFAPNLGGCSNEFDSRKRYMKEKAAETS